VVPEAKDTPTRGLSVEEAKDLRAGDPHYTAYVGPPAQYDFMGATQFRLLCALGLREHHRVLDFGCGSLRAGRFLISYLRPGLYHGLEPNAWLIEDALEREVGQDVVRIKQPAFLHHDTFSCREFGKRFDFVLAQSIFSHTGRDLAAKILAEFSACLEEDGLAAVTFVHATGMEQESRAQGWIYRGAVEKPHAVRYRPGTILEMVRSAGLHGIAIPWYHPRQVWYVLGRSPRRLPEPSHFVHLTGAVLFDPEFEGSVSSSWRGPSTASGGLSVALKKRLRALLGRGRRAAG
jgi:SAM-dependent methyltransferase